MPKLFEELEILCDADKRKSTNELPFVSAHMLHDLYLRWLQTCDQNYPRKISIGYPRIDFMN